MRKLDLITINEELFEVVARVPYHKIRKEIRGENASILKEYYRVEKILKSNQTGEYLFVNLIPEAKIE